MKIARQNNKGVTLLELLVVITIIGILVLISLPNIFKIITMHRIRTSANDVLIKARFVRELAIKTRRRLNMQFTDDTESFYIQKMGHTEYDLLKDIATAISKAQPINTDEYILYVEKGGFICPSTWANALLPDATCEYYVGGSLMKNGVDTLTSDCDPIIFNASGTIDSTCTITITNTMLNRQYDIMLYKGGQMKIKATFL